MAMILDHARVGLSSGTYKTDGKKEDVSQRVVPTRFYQNFAQRDYEPVIRALQQYSRQVGATIQEIFNGAL
jgi:hypothetical protein